MSSGSTTSGDPWAWLGLLKWSLAYTDGTTDAADVAPMSEEDKAFLEAVMREGIVNESERMKTILKEVTDLMEKWRKEPYTVQEEETAQRLLQELRDIVEQIDYARMFAAMKGLPFLLGCVGERQAMPRSIRLICLGLLATLCQNNPPVQNELLQLGSLRVLSDMFFTEDDNKSESDADGELRARIVQAISANVRSNELAEAVFCQLDQAVHLVECALGVDVETPVVLLKRALFFLRALITSDAVTGERVKLFDNSILWIIDKLLLNDGRAESSIPEVREMALELVKQVLDQKKSVNTILSRKNELTAKGQERVSELQSLTGDDLEFASVELDLWQEVLSLLAQAVPDREGSNAALLLQDGAAQTTGTLQSQ